MFASKVATSLVLQFKDQVALKIQRGDASKDHGLKKTLEGLRLASVHAADAILEQLLAWREGALETSASGRVSARSSHLAALNRQLAIEAFFMDAARCVVQSAGSCRETIVLQQSIRDELEELSFNWILNADRYVTYDTADVGFATGSGEGEYGPGHGIHPIIVLKDKVVLSASQLLGELSFVSYESLESIQIVSHANTI